MNLRVQQIAGLPKASKVENVNSVVIYTSDTEEPVMVVKEVPGKGIMTWDLSDSGFYAVLDELGLNRPAKKVQLREISK